MHSVTVSGHAHNCKIHSHNMTHLSQMEFLTLISWTISFTFLGLLGGIFHFYSNFNSTFCKQTVETLIRCTVCTVCLCSTKKDARLIWDKQHFTRSVSQECSLIESTGTHSRHSQLL